MKFDPFDLTLKNGDHGVTNYEGLRYAIPRSTGAWDLLCVCAVPGCRSFVIDPLNVGELLQKGWIGHEVPGRKIGRDFVAELWCCSKHADAYASGTPELEGLMQLTLGKVS